ncbi:unnamed protein product [Caenorhabditis sp. 36 PRJEB53466]|nr:unnamed protein product [Caenorhabditis sp. 36 PRJEB53466]
MGDVVDCALQDGVSVTCHHRAALNAQHRAEHDVHVAVPSNAPIRHRSSNDAHPIGPKTKSFEKLDKMLIELTTDLKRLTLPSGKKNVYQEPVGRTFTDEERSAYVEMLHLEATLNPEPFEYEFEKTEAMVYLRDAIFRTKAVIEKAKKRKDVSPLTDETINRIVTSLEEVVKVLKPDEISPPVYERGAPPTYSVAVDGNRQNVFVNAIKGVWQKTKTTVGTVTQVVKRQAKVISSYIPSIPLVSNCLDRARNAFRFEWTEENERMWRLMERAEEEMAMGHPYPYGDSSDDEDSY